MRTKPDTIPATGGKSLAKRVAEEIVSGIGFSAERAAEEGFRRCAAFAAEYLDEMAADHEHAGGPAKAGALREAAEQIRTMPDKLP